MSFRDEMHAISEEKMKIKDRYTAQYAYSELIGNLVQSIKSSIRCDIEQNGELSGTSSLRTHVDAHTDNVEYINALYKAGFIVKDYDFGYELADIVLVTKTKSVFRGASYHFDYSKFGLKLIEDITTSALNEGIQIRFFYASNSEGGIHSKHRYSIPFMIDENDHYPHTLCYEWNIL